MLGDLFGWYFFSLAEFWGSMFQIRIRHILILILVIYWLRKKGCWRLRRDGSCWRFCRCGERCDACCPDPEACPEPENGGTDDDER